MHFNRFVLRIIFAKKQLSIFIIMFVSAFLVMLFFLFFKTFTTYYIDELKLIYPSLYLVKDKNIDSYKLGKLEVHAEIFELNIDNFSVSFDKKDSFTLGSLGIRSFHKSHTPKMLTPSQEQSNTIYLSHKIYKLLQNHKKFKHELFIKSDVDFKMYRFDVKEFKLHDNSKWILLENSVAKKLYRDNFFNKATFYPLDANYDEVSLKQKLSNTFSNIIYSWDEHISLVSRALKESMLYLFSWMTLAIAVLSISSIIFFSRELADDLTHLTKHAFFYAISLRYVYFSYLIITNVTLIVIILTAYTLAFIINDFVTLMLWNVPSYNDSLFLLYIIATTFSITALAIGLGLHRLYYSKSYGLARV
jgi:hypothetical protein